jgi:thioesterase domain-containing protein
VAVIGHSSGGILAQQIACDLAAHGHPPALAVLIDGSLPGDRSRDDDSQLRDHRAKRALKLAGVHARWGWARLRRVPASAEVAAIMTIRTNVRRIGSARPPVFPGRLLYLQAVEGKGPSVPPEAPEYWVNQAATGVVVEVRGDHNGPDSVLSPDHVAEAAAAITHAVHAAIGAGDAAR